MRGIVLLGALAGNAWCAEDDFDDKTSFTVGVAQEVGKKSKTVSRGIEIGLERTLIDDVLEMEVSLSDMRQTTEHEIGVTLMFNKPFQIDSRTEIELGIGRTHSRAATSSDNGRVLGLEFRRWVERAWGWYVQASSTRMSNAAEYSAGLNAGLIFRLD